MNERWMGSPIGRIWIAADEREVASVSFGQSALPEKAALENNPLLERCIAQLEEYFQGKRQMFDLPLAITGTPFQLRVYAELIKIPYGQTRSYKEIAQAIGNPGAMRAVGGANNKNPIPILVPCHRVVGADGSLTGYGGGVKKRLGFWILNESTEDDS